MELGPKRIKTDRDYGKEVRILWIYNRPIVEEFPQLFEGFWDVYEAWYYHEDHVKQGLSPFLFDKRLPQEEQHWQRERFGNYLYGCLISVYFSWDALQSVKGHPTKVQEEVESNLTLIRHINDVVRYLFTALDSISCCIYIAEGKIPSELQQAQAEPKHLSRLTVKSVVGKLGSSGAYRTLTSLLNKPEFTYLSEYRNLLTHRPFPQFYQDPRGVYHLPEDLLKLDSATQHGSAYMRIGVGEYLGSAFEIIVGELADLLPELSSRYRRHI
jgi:hypothetical protein